MLLAGAILLALFVLPSPWGVVTVVVALVVELAETGALLWWSKRRRAQVGAEVLLGRSAEVVVACRPVGQVRVEGELWRAYCEEGADPGDTVRVKAIDRLTLVVEP